MAAGGESRGARSLSGWLGRTMPWQRWADRAVDENIRCGVLVVLCAGIGVLANTVGATAVPPVTVSVLVMIAGVVLDRRRLALVVVAALVAVLVAIVRLGWHDVRPFTLATVLVSAVVADAVAHSRARLGMSGGRREAMLIELRDSLRDQGELPALPEGWHAEVEQREAGGQDFGGDFIVSRVSPDASQLEIAVVDVSGKGLDAGTRALQLAGALGGLLGAVPVEEFLPAANTYLLRQEWAEGFATAVHLVVDLSTGSYRLATAGHPPPAQLLGGSGRWRLVETDGPILGLLTDPVFRAETGELASTDALLLYTDGLVELPGWDLTVGIDRLLGEAERLIPRGFTGGARSLMDAIGPQAADDRALVLVWRR